MIRKIYSKKKITHRKKSLVRITALLFFFTGIAIIAYAFLPIATWHIYFAPAIAESNITVPIPKQTFVNSAGKINNSYYSVDYTNARNWFPSIQLPTGTPRISSFSLSIPKLSILKAKVTTVDTDLSSHLVNYPGTAIPPDIGNAVIFGHSTLPQLFNPKDYKTIFAKAYTLKEEDEILIHVANITYTYNIYALKVVDADDTSVFSQEYRTSHITLITCTPPGTTWKRLLIKATLQSL